ncbi:hypothetical protein DPMN_074933 [Dreissena polymorpha]|uniref:Uncharacterized protein n=1 Tax=Dreissena polymorpha TaxID=45954 RepID=A0A9D3YK61_DREPO|nr:hypothetical protein DPMN_074933 [Dreissena polymorpha]
MALIGNRDPNYANVHVDSVNSVVTTMLYNQPEFASNHTEDVNVFLEASCPFNCSGKGNCTLRNGDGKDR